MFVLLALLEYFVLNWLEHRTIGGDIEKEDLENQANLEPLVVEEANNETSKHKYKVTKLAQLKKITPERLDQLAKLFYPILFILYALVYLICVV